MIAALLLAGLVLIDCMLAGFRAAAGRNGSLDKRRYYRDAMFRGAAVGVVLVSLFAAAIELADLWPAALAAARPLVWIYGVYATVVLSGFAFYFLPVGCYRILTSVVVFGPLTLIRRWVIVGGLAYLVVSAPGAPVVALAVAAAVAMLAVEPLLARSYADQWRGLVGSGRK